MISSIVENYISQGNLYLLMEKEIARPPVAMAIERMIGRYAWATLCAVRAPHRATAAIMAVTACRWGELDDINLPALFAGLPVIWRPSKGSAPRVTQLRFLAGEGVSSRLSAETPPYVVQYPAHAVAVRHAARSVGLEPSGVAHKATHVWRHLRAWHMLEQCYSRAYIAATLGHRNPDSTEYYIRSRPANLDELIHSKE